MRPIIALVCNGDLKRRDELRAKITIGDMIRMSGEGVVVIPPSLSASVAMPIMEPIMRDPVNHPRTDPRFNPFQQEMQSWIQHSETDKKKEEIYRQREHNLEKALKDIHQAIMRSMGEENGR